MGVLVLRDPDGTAEKIERVAMEHATTVLAMEMARLQTLAEGDTRLRSNLVLELVAGAERAWPGQLLNRAQALGYDLGRPHRVVVVEAHGDDDEIGLLLPRSAGPPGTPGWGRCSRPGCDVVMLADAEVPWDQFRAARSAELHGGHAGSGWAAGAGSWTSSRCPTRKRSWR